MKVKLSKVYKSCSDAQSLGLWRLRLAEGWSLRREFKPQESGILPICFFFFEGVFAMLSGVVALNSLVEISSLFPEVKVYSMSGIVFFQHQKPSPSCGTISKLWLIIGNTWIFFSMTCNPQRGHGTGML